MKASVCSEYAPPDVLQLEEVDKPARRAVLMHRTGILGHPSNDAEPSGPAQEIDRDGGRGSRPTHTPARPATHQPSWLSRLLGVEAGGREVEVAIERRAARPEGLRDCVHRALVRTHQPCSGELVLGDHTRAAAEPAAGPVPAPALAVSRSRGVVFARPASWSPARRAG
jgi:hypothetical protein